jgi:putative cell wall-binding protein
MDFPQTGIYSVESPTLAGEEQALARSATDKPEGKTSYGGKAKGRYWSGYVTGHSNALDLESKVFALNSPRQIARSLKRSAETSKRRKGTPYQSAMSMLNFYINRAGKNISARRKRILESAKGELRKAFGRE